MGGVAAQVGGGDGLAVEPLLEVGEGRDAARLGADEQLAVDRGVEVERFDEVGEGAGDVVAGAGVEPPLVALGDGLDADAVPFPFGGVVGGVERPRSPSSTAWESITGRNGAAAALTGFGASPVEPGEERHVGRRQAVPQLLDLGDVLAAEVGERLLGEPRGHADPEPAGDELEQREAAGDRRAGRAAPRRPAAPRGARRRGGGRRPRRARDRRARPAAGQTSAMVSARSPTKS